ncbi:MAG TPA: type II and III secretion system protein, partial [Firmicutes bacterium]|nr:type II and III secretion system protein [Bacillota bacterium]
RRAETDVRLRDGGTLVIGGLLNNEEAKNNQGLPFLSKLPILGHLFASKSFQSGKTQLVIFVTPRLIQDGKSPQAADIITPPTADRW